MPDSNTYSILIVEDEQAIAKALALKLSQVGYQVDVVFDGQAAIDQVMQKQYDLMLLDLLMPVKDGWEVLTAMQGKPTKIIVTSNLNQEEDVKRAQQLGAVDFLVKSNVTLSQIVAKVQQVLGVTTPATS